MRPRVKSYVYFDQHPEGVFFRSGGEAFILRGRGIYPIVAKLVERLDGQSDLQQLSNALPEALRPLLAAIVTELAKRNFLIDCAGGAEAAITAEPLGLQDEQILAYLADHVRQPWPVFARWRDRAIVLVGDGHIAAAACAALLQLGSRATTQVPALDALQGVLACLPADPALMVAIDMASEADIAAISLIAPATLVATQCRGAMIVIPASHLARLPRGIGGAEQTPARAQCALAGKLLAHDLFIRETGAAGEAQLANGKHIHSSLRVLEFALDPAAAAEPVRVATDRPLSDFERFWAALDPLFQAPTGVFRLNALPETSQLPLFHRQISLSGAGGRSVRGWGLGFEDSSRRALRHAVEAYAMESSDDRAFVLAGFSHQEAQVRLDLMLAYADLDRGQSSDVSPLVPGMLEGDALVLFRLCQKLGAQPFDVVIRTWPDRHGAVAEISAEGRVLAIGVEADRDAAIIEALGAFCSSLQNAEPGQNPLWQQPLPIAGIAKCNADQPFDAYGLFIAAALRQPEIVL